MLRRKTGRPGRVIMPVWMVSEVSSRVSNTVIPVSVEWIKREARFDTLSLWIP